MVDYFVFKIHYSFYIYTEMDQFMTLKYLSQYLLILLLVSALSSCITAKLKVNNQDLDHYLESSEIFGNSFTGFSLYDPSRKDYIFRYNDKKFFTPASNTKLFTFYAGKKILGDSIPGIRYVIKNDTLYFTGTGDPTFLDVDFHNQPIYHFLKASPYILSYCEKKLYGERFGPGWAWDDYMYYFSPEKSTMPIYGNVIRLSKLPEDSVLTVSPPYFQRSIIYYRDSIFQTSRIEQDNLFMVHQGPYPDTIDRKIPFKYSSSLLVRLLSDTLRKPVLHSLNYTPDMPKVIYSQPTDSVMKKMLVESDNFIAEQILIMGSGIVYDTLDTDPVIAYAIDTWLPEFRDRINWVDGSGLSRYNKFTPEAMVALLHKIYIDYSRESIIKLFPMGGVSGTLKNNFKNEIPFIVAKTGSMTGVYNLSGFLITRKGKWLIFSFMNNNFEVPVTSIKSEMEKILKNIYMKF